jgi:hypothetical protein
VRKSCDRKHGSARNRIGGCKDDGNRKRRIREAGEVVARTGEVANAGTRETRSGAARIREVANAGRPETRSGAAAVRSRVQNGRAFRRCGIMAARRMRDGSRRTQRQVATMRIRRIADCSEVNVRRGSPRMSRGAQCEADRGVNQVSKVTSIRGHGSRLNAQTLVPVRGSEKANVANTSIRLKAEREQDIASDEQSRPWESNERANPRAGTWK